MKGKSPNAAQKRFHDLLATHIGCPACFKDTGMRNTHVSIHHLDGRTKTYAHWYVLPLCAGHHQDGYGEPGMIAVHPFKTRFEQRYGKQIDILRRCIRQLQEMGHQLPPDALSIL